MAATTELFKGFKRNVGSWALFGPGITGVPGYNGAQVALQDMAGVEQTVPTKKVVGG